MGRQFKIRFCRKADPSPLRGESEPKSGQNQSGWSEKKSVASERLDMDISKAGL